MTVADRQPWRASIDLDDFEAFQTAFSQWDGSFTQMSRGAFRGRLSIARGRHLRAFRAETNQSILTRGTADPGSVTVIPITRSSQRTRWRGRWLDRGDLLIRGTETEYHNQSSRDACLEGLVVPKHLLDRAAEILTAGQIRLDWTNWHALRPDPEATARLHARIVALVTPPDLAAGAAEIAHSEAETLCCLVDALRAAGNVPDASDRPDNRGRLVLQAKELMRARLSDHLTAIELCATLGVSDRLLRLAFHEAHGMGPLAFFRLMRLHAVRDALRDAQGRDLRVADIFRQLGVTRPGAFAGEYRRHFGELPSEALGLRERRLPG